MSDALPIPLFICTARDDQNHLEALDKHLATLKRQGRVTVWHDQHLLPSAEWEPELLEHLRRARIVLLLISPDFMASTFIHDVELTVLMERHARGEVRLVPVLVRPTDLEGHPLTRFQGLPRGLVPVTLHASPDLGWLEVVKGLRALLDALSPPPEKARPASRVARWTGTGEEPRTPTGEEPRRAWESAPAERPQTPVPPGVTASPQSSHPAQQPPRGPEFSALTGASAQTPDLPPFDPGASAGLFVGVSRFYDASGRASSEFLTIPFAVDDAIDLAAHFTFVLKLLPARRVHLLLSGEPQKLETQAALSRLRAEGATLSRATFTQVLDALAAVAQEAGPEGLLLISAATHGLSADGERLLCEDSRRERLSLSSVAWTTLEQLVTRSACPRRLLLLDACREHVTAHRSGGMADATRLADAIQTVQGLAVLCGAPPGGYCYDDPQRQNGAFTALLLEGLRQGAPANAQGLVTLKALAMWVDQALLAWLKQNSRGSSAGLGISMRLEPVSIGELPLVVRAGLEEPVPLPALQPPAISSPRTRAEPTSPPLQRLVPAQTRVETSLEQALPQTTPLGPGAEQSRQSRVPGIAWGVLAGLILAATVAFEGIGAGIVVGLVLAGALASGTWWKQQPPS